MSEEPYVIDSAFTHSVAMADIVHAFNNPILIDLADDEGLMMVIGPDRAGNLLEIGCVESDDGPVVVHAMPARAKYLPRRR
jgi:hypothetical protein